MDLGLVGRVAIVSGASRGIGKGIARTLLAEGVNVLLASYRPGPAAAAEELDVHGPNRVAAIDVDLTGAAGAALAVADAVRRWGTVHIAVTNVAAYAAEGDEGPHPHRFDDLPLPELRMGLRQQVLSAWHLANACLPSMRSQGWGRIVNISSRVAREVEVDVPHFLSHTMRPAAAALSKVLAAEVAPHGITVNSVLPAATQTERTTEFWTWMAERQQRTIDEVLAEHHAGLPLGRMATVDEQAAMVAFLCSDRAASITGQAILTDGGASRGVY